MAWEESLRRYYKSKSRTGHAQEKVYEVRKAKGAAILDPDDAIKDVLDENDFVTVGKGILIMHILRSCNVYHRINDRSCKYWVGKCIGGGIKSQSLAILEYFASLKLMNGCCI